MWFSSKAEAPHGSLPLQYHRPAAQAAVSVSPASTAQEEVTSGTVSSGSRRLGDRQLPLFFRDETEDIPVVPVDTTPLSCGPAETIMSSVGEAEIRPTQGTKAEELHNRHRNLYF